jgi:farnesyl diphosphate synthase
MISALDELIPCCESRLQTLFSHYLQNIPSPDLKAAMEYSLSSGGKRVRPLLIYTVGILLNASWEILDIPASAIELIHTYSLIHDDLPAMDNADLRRHRPTCHKVYGEGIAILAGDACHTLAVQILASHSAPLKAQQRLQMLNTLSHACGPLGMASGQALDITIMNKLIPADLLEHVYRLKTGALFSACIELGIIASGNDDELTQASLNQFGKYISLAFQIQDDIFDMESEAESIGKSHGIDAKNNKITYPTLHDLNTAKNKVQALYEEALDAINHFGSQAQLLRELTTYLLYRKK